MVAQRKSVQTNPQTSPAIIETPRSRPAPASVDMGGGLNPALAAQRLLLETVFAADEPAVRRYPGALRLAIILGGATGLWALVAGALRLVL